jgi:hypothetical protein
MVRDCGCNAGNADGALGPDQRLVAASNGRTTAGIDQYARMKYGAHPS